MRVIREISRGGFGVVHEVRDGDGERFARKTFDPQLTGVDEEERLLRRFAREVRIQSQIRHPNIMPILKHDLSATPPWFVMPMADLTFEGKIAKDRAIGNFDTTPWQDILAAVEELHRLGYVHRDLKPANILRVDGKWMLSDFGLILPLARDTTVLTSSQSAYGSHYYAAPEQAVEFRNTPEQADIFALGCILHDAVDSLPRRTPFAQIRISGPYGPLLEKCTEVDPRRRFPSIAALREALFELWRTAEFARPSPDDESLLESIQSDPGSADAWRELINRLEGRSTEEQAPVLHAINADLLIALHGADELLFGRLLEFLCNWASGSAFEWSYCDVVGDRLLEAYRISPVRLKVLVVLAALELAVSHNRWHVMKQVGAMLSAAAENGLVDRLLIEMSLERRIEGGLRTIEQVVHWNRDRWHERIAKCLSSNDAG